MKFDINIEQLVHHSFITSFEASNEGMIDNYFSQDLQFFNHSIGKKYTLEELKQSVLRVHQKYLNIKSEIKDIIVENNRIAFHVLQHAFYVPEKKEVQMNVMNVYRLEDGKIKDWSLWFSQN